MAQGSVRVPWSDARRRTVCRVAFLVGCLLPTLITAYIVGHRPTLADWQERIQAHTRLAMVAESLDTPRPGIYVFQQVSWKNPELIDLATIPRLQLEAGPEWNLQIPGTMRLKTRALAALVRSFCQDVVPHSSVSNSLEIRWDRWEVTSSRRPQKFVFLGPVSLQVRRRDDGAVVARLRALGEPSMAAEISGTGTPRVPSGESREVLDLELTQTGQETTYRFNTQGSRFPLWLFEEIWPEAEWLSNASTWAGAGTLVYNPMGLSGECNGLWENVPLEKITSVLNQPVQGVGNVEIRQLLWNRGKITQLHGIISSPELRGGVALFQHLGTWPSDNGTDQTAGLPNLPDFRGEFLIADGRLKSQIQCQLQGQTWVSAVGDVAVQDPVTWLTQTNSSSPRPVLTNRGVAILSRLQLESAAERSQLAGSQRDGTPSENPPEHIATGTSESRQR